MGKKQKLLVKRVSILCLLLLCLFTTTFSKPVHAAGGPAKVTLTAVQVFTKPADHTVNETVTYELKRLNASHPMPNLGTTDVHTFTITGTAGFDIPVIEFGTPGDYSYKVTAQMGTPARGYSYDSQVYTIRIHISADFEATLTITNKEGTKVGGLDFAHSYAPHASDPSLMVDPPVKKTVSGNPSQNATFTFRLEARDPASPMPAGSSGGVKTITIVGSGQGEFGTWSYTQPGTYYYKISEVNTGAAGYTYDTMVYTITDKVEDVNGQLVLVRTVTNSSNKPVQSCDFINKYTAGTSGGGGGTGSGGGTGGGSAGPKTGDDSMLEVYRASLGISSIAFMACFVLLLASRKRRKKAARQDLICHENA